MLIIALMSPTSVEGSEGSCDGAACTPSKIAAGPAVGWVKFACII